MLILRETEPTFQDFYLDLLVRYAQLEKFNGLKIIRLSSGHAQLLKVDVIPQLLTSKNEQIYSMQDISEHLLKLVNWDTYLIGGTVEERTETTSFFDLVASADKDTQKLLEPLQNHLKESTFLTGNTNLKVADLYVFARLFHHMVTAPTEELIKYFNVYRWFDYVQNMTGIKQNLIDMRFRLMEQIHVSEIVEHAPRPDHPEGKDHPEKQEKTKQKQGQQQTGDKKAEQGKEKKDEQKQPEKKQEQKGAETKAK